MKKEDRFNFYRTKLAEIERKEGAFVIFTNPDTGKFIQFAAGKGEIFFADIPVCDLSNDEITRLASLGLKEGSIGNRYFELVNIPGVGFNRAWSLLNHFGELADITEASEEELRKVPGIGKESH